MNPKNIPISVVQDLAVLYVYFPEFILTRQYNLFYFLHYLTVLLRTGRLSNCFHDIYLLCLII